MTLTRGTTRPFQVTINTDGATDMTATASVDLYVHRAYESETETIETWTSTSIATTSSKVVATFTPTVSGTGALTVDDETIKARPVCNFSSGPPFEAAAFLINVEER